MGNFNINILEKELIPYVNDPAIAFFNVLRGIYTPFENSTNMSLKKINSEVLLKDIVKRNNAISLESENCEVKDNTNLAPILRATIQNPNSLSKVGFIIKESFFENNTSNITNGSLPADLFQLGSNSNNLQPINFSTIDEDIIEYNIQNLNNLFVKNYEASSFFTNAIRGYIDIYYNFRTENTTFSTNINEWSILRVQFNFISDSSQNKEYITNQINIIRRSDYNNEMTVTKEYPLEYLKGTDRLGNKIPIYYYGENNVNDNQTYLDVQERMHLPGYFSNQKVLPVGVDDGHYPLNALNPPNGRISVLLNQPTSSNVIEMLKVKGLLVYVSQQRNVYNAWHIFGLIEDNQYIPLI